MLSEKIYTLGILIYYGLVVSVIFTCFFLLFLDVNDTVNNSCVNIIFFLLGKFSILITSKLLRLHNQRLLRIESAIQSIPEIISESRDITPDSSSGNLTK